ncbi:sugar ABC transporter permease, partial [Idiomarina sp. Sol25]
RNYLEYVDFGDGEGQYYGLLADPRWWRSVWNTILFAAVSVSFETVFGLIIALVLNQQFRGRAFVRAAVLIPWAIPTIVSAKMWAWMLHDQFGIINDMFMALGLISE